MTLRLLPSHRNLKPLLLCGALAVATAGYWWFSAHKTQPSSATSAAPVIQFPSVSVVKVELQPTAERLSVSGTLVARDPITVAAELDARRVSNVWVDVGQKVKKGQKLLSLSTDTLQAELDRATQQLAIQKAAQEEARAAEEEAQLTLQRTQLLFDKGFSKRAALDSAHAAAKTATARYNAAVRGIGTANAGIKNAQALFNKSVIVAPADGILANRHVFVGDTIRAGQALFLLIKDNKIELQADIAETDLPLLVANLPVTVKPASMTQTLSGTIRLVVPQIDEKTRLARLLVSLPVHDSLRAGGFATGEVMLPSEQVMSVPITSLQTDSGKDIVLVVDNNDTIVQKPVTTGRRIGNSVVILQGLNSGDLVVRTAGPFLAAGMRVRPVASNVE